MEPGDQTRVLLIEPSEGIRQKIDALLKNEGFNTSFAEEGGRALGMIYNNPPDLILVDMEPGESHLGELCMEIRSDNIYGHLPLIAVLPKGVYGYEEIRKWMVGDFIYKPFELEELLLRIRLALVRDKRSLDANALTRLPGNNTIVQQIQNRIDAGESFSLAYLDVDNFKSFNDCYGFSRGDEVLRMTARLLGNVVYAKGNSDAFVGHIGGDDFVFITRPETVGVTCVEIIQKFDQIVPVFYDESDRARGYIESVDRQGQTVRFPLMTVSIGVAFSRNIKNLSHFGQIATVASEMKKFAKKHPGSIYFFDNRVR